MVLIWHMLLTQPGYAGYRRMREIVNTTHRGEGKMTKRFLRCTTAIAALGFATAAATGAQAQGATQGDIEINWMMQGKFQPTYVGAEGLLGPSSLFTDAGVVQTDDEHVRTEMRYGASATGDDWKARLVFESDFVIDINTADRGGTTGNEFGIERADFTYEFNEGLNLEAGWAFKTLDIGTGGLLYGDDAPYIGFTGGQGSISYEAYWMPIIEATASGNIPGRNALDVNEGEADTSVFAGKLNFDLGGGDRVSPLLAHSRNNQRSNTATWFGGEYVGNFGKLNVLAEALGVVGEFDGGANNVAFNPGVNVPAGGANLSNNDIQAYAAYASAKYSMSDAFQPYASFRLNSGDDDPFDDDVEGWLGITDISRFSGHDGIDGGFFGMQPINSALGSGLFGTAFDFAGPASGFLNRGGNGATFGGIQNSGSGLNPGQVRGTIGSSGNLSPNLSYHGQINALWYESTGGLEVLPNAQNDVSNFAGVQGTAQLKYAFNDYVSARAIASVFDPGEGVDDAIGTDDTAGMGTVELLWSF